MEKEIVVNGSKITYFEEGEGFPFLIIHGWGPWLGPPYVKFRELLTGYGYRVIFINLPGFGKSSGPSPQWGMDEYLEKILNFIDQMNLEKFYLVGHSMGGAMSIKLAASYPERIKALILLSPGVFRPLRFWGINIEVARLVTIGLHGYFITVRFMEIFLALISTIIKNLGFSIIKLIKSGKTRNFLEEEFKEAFKKVNDWLNKFWKPQDQFFFSKEKLMAKILGNIVGIENILIYLPEIKPPTLVVWGEKDRSLLFLYGRFMGRIPDYEFRLIPEAGHNLQEDAPEKVAELIMNFIKKIKRYKKVTLSE